VRFAHKHKQIVECLLFVSNRPLTPEVVSNVVEIDSTEAKALLQELKKEYELQNRGIQIVAVAGGYRMCTKPEFAAYVEKLYRPQISPLSKAALETLAIVAYRQPITRAEIESIRGVKTEGVLTNLMERKLIQEVGRKEGPGRPILYGTTEDFLQYLGLNGLHELPSLEQAPKNLES
jgi:segregation and condensation protein B